MLWDFYAMVWDFYAMVYVVKDKHSATVLKVYHVLSTNGCGYNTLLINK